MRLDDLIKRSDAIKSIEELPNAYNGWSDAYDKAYIIGTLEEVPSADRPSAVDLSSVYSTAYKSGYEKGKADIPQGEWIRDRYWSRGVGMGEEYGFFYKCSLCEYEIENGYTRCGFNFCPYCGARMR